MNLERNNLSILNSEILEHLSSSSSKINKLTLTENPWLCDCSSYYFLNFVQDKYQDLVELENVTCADTNNSISKLIFKDICPMASDSVVTTICSITILLVVILSSILTLYFYYEKNIKIWLYSKNLCSCLMPRDDRNDEGKIYDAFISYSHDDEDFVMKELVSKLEQGPRTYKLCIHSRDWFAGDWIPTQISRSIGESKRTIVVISRNFLDGEWTKMEFRAAHKQALGDKTARVIIVIFGDIGSIDDLDDELRSYLKMNTYIEWGDPWFWKKLKYDLPHEENKHFRNGNMIVGNNLNNHHVNKDNNETKTIIRVLTSEPTRCF